MSLVGMLMGARREENVMSAKTVVDLFTPEEHRILSNWLEIEPDAEGTLPPIEDALRRLGFEDDPGLPYSNVHAAVAFIVLEPVEKRLPQWSIVDENDEIQFARDYRPKELIPARRAAMLPQYLFTLNWADSGPGFSWPGAYYTTWVPLYERFVVTYSADTPEVWGYADIAIGQFDAKEGLKDGSQRIIIEDWRMQRDECSQERWGYLFGTGLVDEAEAKAWADEVWGE